MSYYQYMRYDKRVRKCYSLKMMLYLREVSESKVILHFPFCTAMDTEIIVSDTEANIPVTDETVTYL